MNSNRLIGAKFGAIWATLLLAFIVVPVLVVLFVSLTSADYLSFPWDHGFSLRWYDEILHQPQFITAAKNSLEVGLYATLIGGILGSITAFAIIRYRVFGGAVFTVLGTSPLFVPQVMTGLAMAIVLPDIGLQPGFTLLIIGNVLITIPYVFRVVSASLVGLDQRLEWAAMDLGATRLRVLRSVVLPQVLPALVSGAVMAFIISIENITVSIFLVGPGYTLLPVQLFNVMSDQYTPLAASLSICLVIIVALGAGVAHRFSGLDKVFGGDVK